MKRIDLTGQRFSKLNVLTYSHTDKGRSHWKCQCDCGNTPTVAGTDLRTGGTKSCGCYKSAKGSRSFKWKGCGDVPHTYYSCIKSGAKHRDIPFDLSISYMWKLFLQQD